MQIALPKPSLWTLASGLEALDFGAIRLGGFSDDFADGVRHAIWQDCGVVPPIESGGVLNIDTTQATEEVGYETVNTISGPFDVQIDFSNWVPPTVGSGGIYLQFYINSNNFFIATRYKLPAPSTLTWIARWMIGGSDNSFYIYTGNVDNGKLRIVRDGSLIQIYRDFGSGWSLMEAAYGFSTAAGKLRFFGYMSVGADAISLDFDNFIANKGMFQTIAPVAESPWTSYERGTLDATTPIYIEENKFAAFFGYSGGTLKYQYALNNGSYNGTWLTQAQLQSALAGQTITDETYSLRLKVQFNSNGSQAVDISGFGSCVQSSVLPAFQYPFNAEAKGNEYEATVNLDEYDVEVAAG